MPILSNEEWWATLALEHHGAEAPDCLQVQYEDVDDLAAVAADVDILYQTRIQKERFQVLSLISSSSALPAGGRCLVSASSSQEVHDMTHQWPDP